MTNRERNYFFQKEIEIKTGQCPEFPFFGAHYPDAGCIDGELWDLDKCDENGLYSSGDNPPCPFCNTKNFLKQNEDDDAGNSRYQLLKYLKSVKDKYHKNYSQ